MNSRLSSLILLLHVQGFLTLEKITVTCHKQNICAGRASHVILWCFYSDINIRTGFWFSQKQSENWRIKEEPEDLILDLDYSGRVTQRITYDYSRFTITNLRETDSGKFRLMFIMKDGEKRLSSVTVSLTVTVLQVKMNHESTDQQVKLTCDTSCTLTFGYDYRWYKNEEHLINDTSRHIFVSSSSNNDRYSCSVSPDFYYPSSSVCVSNSSCWDVIYSSRRVCALVGSTVDIPSTYSLPTGYTVEKTFWQSEGFIDLREEPQFAGRVEYVRNTLRIKDAKMSDSGEYIFRIITNASDGKYSGLPGVILTVTDTQVIFSPDPVVDGEKVILSCSTECTLDNNHTYIWYKNGTQVTDGFTLLNKLYLDSVSSEEIEEYSCAVGETTGSSTFGHLTVCLLVFSPQFLIIGVLWMWFCSSMNKLKTRTDDKNEKE